MRPFSDQRTSSGRPYDEQPTSRGRPQDRFTDHHLTISDVLRTSVCFLGNSFRIERTATKCIDLKNRLYVLSIDLNLIFMEGETPLLSHWEIEKSIFF